LKKYKNIILGPWDWCRNGLIYMLLVVLSPEVPRLILTAGYGSELSIASGAEYTQRLRIGPFIVDISNWVWVKDRFRSLKYHYE
jgi:hypothetical protein